MWMYLALGVGILVTFNVLIVVMVSALARHAEPRDERDELDAELRARLLSYVRQDSVGFRSEVGGSTHLVHRNVALDRHSVHFCGAREQVGRQQLGGPADCPQHERQEAAADSDGL